MQTRVLICIAGFLLGAGCTRSESPPADTDAQSAADQAGPVTQQADVSRDETSFEPAYAAAVAAIAESAEKGHAWLVPDRLIVDAREAADSGDEARATELANEARRLAELASQQADSEKEEWRRRPLPVE